jgi:phosphoribosylformimino-5-aminoimidazole carboxamide ribotide isomerase
MKNIVKKILVIPSIDIKDGKIVRIVKEIPELECVEYGDDPFEMALIWRAENAKLLHIVDFDCSQIESKKNFSIIEQICKSIIIPVEFAGGIRSINDVNELFNIGVHRLALGTLAIEDLKSFREILDKFGPTKIVASLDILDDFIAIRSRRVKTDVHYLDFAKKLSEIGVERFIVTDVRKNGLMEGINLDYSLNVAKLTNKKVTLSGGVSNYQDLIRIQEHIADGIDSVIIGRAFYENKFPCQKIWRIAESGIFS